MFFVIHCLQLCRTDWFIVVTGRRCGLQLPSRSAAGRNSFLFINWTIDYCWHWFLWAGVVTFSSARKTFLGSVSIRAGVGRLGSGSNHVTADEKPLYHPFEEITQVSLQGRDARLTSAETCRTIIEVPFYTCGWIKYNFRWDGVSLMWSIYQVNSKATLMFSGFDDDVILDNLFWPDLPYVSDEHGSK